MQDLTFADFFQGPVREHLLSAVRRALEEDGPDLTSNAVFSKTDTLQAHIVAKESTIMAGLPLATMILEETASLEPGSWTLTPKVLEGAFLHPGTTILTMQGSARLLLRAERIILNFICHLSGVANLVNKYVRALDGTGVRLLDTRKTLPGLRYPEKYAVLVGGGFNHRKNLAEMLMLKDNHIDAAGGVTPAVDRLRVAYDPVPPIEVECRTLAEVSEAVACEVQRIMLDNMLESGGEDLMRRALELVPQTIEVEVSGGVTLENIGRIAGVGGARKPDFISVGRLTHSAPAADYSMRTMLAGRG